jgi:hypothetical protein
VVLQSLKESPAGARPAFERDVEAESANRIARLGERMAAYSATVRSLLTAKEDEAALADQQRKHQDAVTAAVVFAFGTALACGVLLVMRGVVLGLTELLGGRVWLASLVAGLVVLLAFVLAFLAATVVLARRRERGSRVPQPRDVRRRRPGAVTRHTLF